LIGVAVVCALLFFATVFIRSWVVPGIGLGLLLLTSVLLAGIWPYLMQSFQVRPSEPDREGPFIARNIEATREAYGVSGVEMEDYSAATTLPAEEVRESAESRVSTRLLDPTLISPAFQQLQQVRGYYTVPQTLDVGRYRLDGEDLPQDVIIAAREVNLDGLQPNQRNWANDHTVYTHGYGIIAARGNQRGPQGEPVWVQRDIPPVDRAQPNRAGSTTLGNHQLVEAVLEIRHLATVELGRPVRHPRHQPKAGREISQIEPECQAGRVLRVVRPKVAALQHDAAKRQVLVVELIEPLTHHPARHRERHQHECNPHPRATRHRIRSLRLSCAVTLLSIPTPLGPPL
ncbi:MAG: UPF0182 family protein, partial [Gemmatimonadetes bacterium]|nr:UPF0182 family protein [Gemmatimonadota bacterium]